MTSLAGGASTKPTTTNATPHDMLTSDLARYELQGNEARPRYVTRKEAAVYLPLCASIIETYQASLGHKRRLIEEALGKLEHHTDFKVVRGLAKLVEDGCEFAPPTDLDVRTLRSEVFQTAQAYYPLVTTTDLLHTTHRDEAVAAIGAKLGHTSLQLETSLFADLPEHQVLKTIDRRFTPESLLQRYNVALAQALLYKATEMTINLKSDYKLVWKYIKLTRLIHEIDRLNAGYRIRLTGPASVFRYTEKYGVRFADFLPGLLLARDFSMDALVTMRGQQRAFRLDSGSGLRSHYHEPEKEFDSTLERRFYEGFSALADSGWHIERESDIIDLGDTVVIPDFTFRSNDGKKAMLEIVGFWTPEYIEKKLGKLARVRDMNFIIALSQNLSCARTELKTLNDKKLVYFKGVLKAKNVLACLQGL